MSHDSVERTLRFLSDMDYSQWAALAGGAAATYATYLRYTRISLDDVPGPENPSFLHGALRFSSQWSVFDSTHPPDTVGNLPNLQGAEAGELESHYLTTYGSIVRWKGALGVREFSKTEHPFPLPDWGLDK